ncbi:sugar phosphate isomerase/epimerase family protein [Paratractidigestivibacter sp.]|uniref:sugar phosphate isomerase/epimerase family protein n=1 Tax=Paratractidigestivibacter sp. TaxID=2847316 RepID=UPI002ABE3870|nr:sugar phosphate isomerase/epimerase family protein [Paratractidigestivibacter sp.]
MAQTNTNPTSAFSVGVRLHDLPEGNVEERIRMAGELGFTCIQLPSKVMFKSYGIDRTGLTLEFAEHLRGVLDEAGVHVAVFGCYKNLATPDAAQLADNLEEYAACLHFAALLGGCPVGTETGRPNTGNKVADDRFSAEAMDAFCAGLAKVCAMAEEAGVPMLIEPGWNEVVNTPERCRDVLDRVSSPSLGVIYDGVSLLHPTVAAKSTDVVARMLELNGDAIRVLHAKDYEVVDNEDSDGWCDGSGSRLVCHGAGETGAFDFAQIADWARKNHPGIDCVIENSTPATNASCRDYLLGL